MPRGRVGRLPKPTREGLRTVALDRTSGARALELHALAALVPAVRTSGPGWRGRARAVARQLRSTQPAMGAFRRWGDAWDRFARLPASVGPLRAAGWLDAERRAIREEAAGLRRTAGQLTLAGLRVVTFSRSDSVRRVLAALGKRRGPAWVDCLESRPGGEGRRFAVDLRSAGLRTRVLRDAGGSRAIARADAFLIGADAVEPDGAVIHKVGTRALARAAVRAGVPVVVVTGRSKRVGRGRGLRRLPRGFDRTPASDLTVYWTEAGVLAGRRSSMSRRSRRPLPFEVTPRRVRRWRS